MLQTTNTIRFKSNEDISKQTFTQVLIEIYNKDDLERVVSFCQKHLYKGAYILHNAESEEKKQHYHFYIQSNTKHRFTIKSLLSETLTYYNFEKCGGNDLVKFCTYALHLEYDMKKKYNFSDLSFCNLTVSDINRLHAKIDGLQISSIDINAIYNKTDFEERLIFCRFKNFSEVRAYCMQTKELTHFFIMNYDRIYRAFLGLITEFGENK